MDKFMTMDEVARVLNVPKKWINAQIKAGRLASYRLGPQTIRVSQEQLMQFIDGSNGPATAGQESEE